MINEKLMQSMAMFHFPQLVQYSSLLSCDIAKWNPIRGEKTTIVIRAR